MKKVLISLAVFIGMFIVIGMLPDRTPLKDSAQAIPAISSAAEENLLDLVGIEMRLAYPGFRFAGHRAAPDGACFKYYVPGNGVDWGFMTTEHRLILNHTEALELCGK